MPLEESERENSDVVRRADGRAVGGRRSLGGARATQRRTDERPRSNRSSASSRRRRTEPSPCLLLPPPTTAAAAAAGTQYPRGRGLAVHARSPTPTIIYNNQIATVSRRRRES